MIVNSFRCKNTEAELKQLLLDADADATRSNNSSRVDSDEIMTVLHALETRALAFKKQGADVGILRRVSERLKALSSQLVISR